MMIAGTRYWKDKQQTRSAMRRHPGDDENLWMHTGDKGVMDKDGYLKSECHKLGAFNDFCTDSNWAVVGRIKVNTAFR
jgi:acyl-CoA synthetase (AMP-forming)/AMP-acid ligase II